MNQMPLECQSRIMVETSNFALSSSHSLRRDVYEKDVRLYWYEGGLRAKKLNFGQSLTPTCMRNSHIDIYHIIYNLIYCIYIYIYYTHIATPMVVGNPKRKSKNISFVTPLSRPCRSGRSTGTPPERSPLMSTAMLTCTVIWNRGSFNSNLLQWAQAWLGIDIDFS